VKEVTRTVWDKAVEGDAGRAGKQKIEKFGIAKN